MTTLTLPLPTDAIRQFCRRWKIRELALFGSVLRTDFRPDSDVDMLVTFTDDAEWGLLAHIQMQQELATLLQRRVDLVSKHALERSANGVRRETILNTAQVIASTDEAGARRASPACAPRTRCPPSESACAQQSMVEPA
jgi:predicted nucleotidyltransferase